MSSSEVYGRAAKPPGDEYETPWELVRELEREFGPFDLDPAAQAHNAKAPHFFTPEVDGLAQPWHGTVFLNPPFGGPGRARILDAWLAKAAHEVARGALVVCLLPAWTDTDWWHDTVWGRAEVRFHRRRVEFLEPGTGRRARPVRATCTVVFRPPAEVGHVA